MIEMPLHKFLLKARMKARHTFEQLIYFNKMFVLINMHPLKFVFHELMAFLDVTFQDDICLEALLALIADMSFATLMFCCSVILQCCS